MTNTIEPNFIRVNNLNNDTVVYISIEKFDSIKNMLDSNCIYEKVYISPNNIIYRTELFL